MDYFNDVLTTFLGLGTFQLCCCLWSLRKLLDFIKNILICVPKMNKFLMDLERHEGVINDRIFIWVNYSLNCLQRILTLHNNRNTGYFIKEQ